MANIKTWARVIFNSESVQVLGGSRDGRVQQRGATGLLLLTVHDTIAQCYRPTSNVLWKLPI